MATMRNVQAVYPGVAERTASEQAACPPAFVEYMWYACLIYGILGEAWGIVIPSVGGALWVLLAVGCFLTQATRVYKPISWALCTAISMLAIQVTFHEWDDKASKEVITIVTWLALLIIAQSLCLRPGFLQRFALVALVIGVAVLPFVQLSGSGDVMRAGASGTGMSNGNSLAMWFGFCVVYFLMWGLQCQKPMLRVASWTAAVGCLYVVAITVSRAPLLAIALACIVGFRSSLKGGFIPLLSLVLVMGLVYISGVFDTEIGYYTARGAEESGRGKLWPRAMQMILDSPWTGYGMRDFKIWYGPNRYVPPHNGPLRIMLEAGIVPLVCFLGYLARVVIGTLRMMQSAPVREAALIPPLVTYALFEVMVLDLVFASAWAAIVFGLAAKAGEVDRHRSSAGSITGD